MTIAFRTIALVAMVSLVMLAGCSDDDAPAGPADPGGADIYVDAVNGDDDLGAGSAAAPYKTITKALSLARSGDVVTAMPGIYDTAIGETFPIDIPDGVTVQGTDWARCTIRVDAEAQGTRHAVTMGCDECAIRNFNFEEDKIVDSFVTYFVNLYQCSGALVDSLRTNQRTILGALKIAEDNGSTVQYCYFNDSEPGYHERGIAVLGVSSGNNTTFRFVTVTGYLRGFLFAGAQTALVEFCNITGNEIGVELCCYGEAATQPNPDFGGGALASAGQNDFSGNASYGILNGTRHAIYAKFNTWAHYPPTSGVDYWNSDEAGGGFVVWRW